MESRTSPAPSLSPRFPRLNLQGRVEGDVEEAGLRHLLVLRGHAGGLCGVVDLLVTSITVPWKVTDKMYLVKEIDRWIYL